MSSKPVMSLSLDLDNKWSYLRTYGNSDWQKYPSYLALVCPRILEFFEERGIKITFFIVGKDATLPENRPPIASLAAAGHEIGNHSFFHEPWLHLYTEEDFEEDLKKSEAAIEDITGKRVNGFRGPGYSITEMTLRVLSRNNYRYDATAFPNILNPLSRAYLFATTKLSREEKKKRKALFGSFSDAFRPVKPYQWQMDVGNLLELPVTTMPVFKTPIHFSYLTYLGAFSESLAHLYLNFAIGMCKVTRTEPSLLMHPLDFMGEEDDQDLRVFPAMGLPVSRKLELMAGFVDRLVQSFSPVTMGQHAEQIATSNYLPQFKPIFRIYDS
jgi:hypothetical protein